MDIILLIAGLLFLGYILKSVGILPEESKRVLNALVLKVTMPCTVLYSMLKNVQAGEIPHFLKLTLLMLLLSGMFLFLTLVIGRYFISDKRTLYAFALVCSAGNTAFMGFPIVEGFFGTEGLVRAIFCDISTLLVILTASTYLGGKLMNINRNIFHDLVKFPPLIAWLVSVIIILFGFSLSDFPPIFEMFLSSLSHLTTPLIMLTVGISLSPRYIKRSLKESAAATSIKLLLMPIAAFIIASLFSFSTLDKNVCTLEAAMPPAMIIPLFCDIYSMNSKFVSATIFISVVSCLVTLPLIYTVLTHI
ncbi:MAG: AEC family transporter [Methanosarcinaceae archaeon]|nr:AEC family transporter [Methanosarcinaceae archaeon]